VHRKGDLYGHFQTLEQQKKPLRSACGFLVTEVLFWRPGPRLHH